MIEYSADDLAALAAAIYGEARSEPRIGQDGVAHVAINRARISDVSVADVVYGSGHSRYGQFSFANPDFYSKTIGNAPVRDPKGWARAVAVAEEALEGLSKDPTGGSTYYYNPDVESPKWARTMPKTVKIGHHQFHKAPDSETRAVTRGSAFSNHRRQPGEDHMVPGIYGHQVMSALDGYRGPAIPFPSERGVSQQGHLARMQMYEPGSGDMGIYERQEPAWSDQFAPGPKAAPKSALQPAPPVPDGIYEAAHPADAMGFATEAPQSALTPRNDYPVAAPTAPQTAPKSRFDKSFTRSIPMNGAPKSNLTPGTSDTAKAAAYRGMADSMAQAGVGSVGGRYATQSREGFDKYGYAHLEHGLSKAPPASNLFAPKRASTPRTSAVPKSAIQTPTPAPRRVSRVPEPQSALLTVPTPTPRPTATAAPKSTLLDVPVPTPRPAQTAVPQSRLQSPVTAGQAASRQSVQSTVAGPSPISALDNPMTGWDPHTDKPAPRSSVGQKYGVPAGRATGALAGAALAGPLGAAVGNALGKSIAQNRTRKGFFPHAPYAPASEFPVAPKAPPKSNFAGGPGSNGLSSYGNQVASDSGQFADAWSSGGLGLY